MSLVSEESLNSLRFLYIVSMAIEFVSYSEKYPCLCFGKLVVKIDGKEVSFGSIARIKADYPAFWASGGSVRFTEDWEPIVTSGEWQLSADEKNYPKRIWKILPQILQVMNDNVTYGCCGGCI